MMRVRQGVLAGVCGADKEFMGKTVHLIPVENGEVAVCGKAPSGRSKGWTDSNITWAVPGSYHDLIVDCPRCRKALAEGKCSFA